MGTGLLDHLDDRLDRSTRPRATIRAGRPGSGSKTAQITHPVNECTIAGNLRDMLMRIIPANDARAHLSTRVPSLLVEGMTLAGA